MEILARRLTELRKASRLSRKEVAEAANMAERTYRRCENAEREPSASAMMALADFYEATLDYLVGRADQ